MLCVEHGTVTEVPDDNTTYIKNKFLNKPLSIYHLSAHHLTSESWMNDTNYTFGINSQISFHSIINGCCIAGSRV